MKAIVFGASGGLAAAAARAFLDRGWQTDLVTRAEKRGGVEAQFAADISKGHANIHSVGQKYSEFEPQEAYDALLYAPALFDPAPLVDMREPAIAAEIEIGLTEPIEITRRFLAGDPPENGKRRDFCYIGSTSAYAGFRNTSVYCAVKHGLLGFVRAMNDEYGKTDARFWLFSMGTMNTEMGRKLVTQDPASFLQVGDVANRIVDSVCSQSNVFEPEVILRRRTIRFLES